MAEPLKQARQDPLVKKEISERFKEVVERSGLDPSVINFRCGWKARTRINNYISGARTPKWQGKAPVTVMLPFARSIRKQNPVSVRLRKYRRVAA